MTNHQNFDCVIVGGGMIGAAAALSLAQLGLSVAIVEKYSPQNFLPEQALDLRVSAISLASEHLLKQLNAWQQISQWRSCVYQRLGVWESELIYTEFNAEEIAQPHLGHIIENRLIQLSLWQQIEQEEKITLFCPTTLQKFKQQAQYTEVFLATDVKNDAENEDKSKKNTNQESREVVLQCKLLIAADGANSQVRHLANIGITGWDYQQSAMLINVATQLPQQNITWQQFLPTGPVAMLPMPTIANQDDHQEEHQNEQFQGMASLVWYHHRDEIKRLANLSNTQLQTEIEKYFPKKLGKIKVINKGAFPLTRRHANCYQQGRVLLLGDAAHTINPLAGQGVNLGFKDVLALQTILAQAIAEGEVWHDLNVLSRYEKTRRKYNLLMMSTMDTFYSAFSHPSRFVKGARNLTLLATNHITPLKKQILKHACGLL